MFLTFCEELVFIGLVLYFSKFLLRPDIVISHGQTLSNYMVINFGQKITKQDLFFLSDNLLATKRIMDISEFLHFSCTKPQHVFVT